MTRRQETIVLVPDLFEYVCIIMYLFFTLYVTRESWYSDSYVSIKDYFYYCIFDCLKYVDYFVPSAMF